MKMKNIYSTLFVLLSVPMLFSCSEDAFESAGNAKLRLVASLGSTRASMSIKDNSLDVVSRWEPDDHIQVYCAKNGDDYLPDSKSVGASNIAREGASAEFIFEPLDSWKDRKGKIDEDSKFAYITNRCYPKYDSESKKLYINASLLRNPIESFNAPTYAVGESSDGELLPVTFTHYYAYELLHISNNTDESIDFSMNGFEGHVWYKRRGSICVDDGKFYQESVATRDAVEYTDMTIKPHETGVLMSAYIPNGEKIEDARLVVTLKKGGDVVKTTNTLNSNVEIKTGRAYHMYVQWDGKELKFGKNNEEEVQHEYVDLGLPSGTVWATCNLGANSQEELGDLYAWGETETKEEFDWDTYKWSNVPYGKDILDPEDDAAHVQWGGDWRMPTYEEFLELYQICQKEWTTENGVYGFKYIGTTGNYIFLPAFSEGEYEGWCQYWASDTDLWGPNMWKTSGMSGNGLFYPFSGYEGLPVRPVCKSPNTVLISSIKIQGTCANIKQNETLQLSAEVLPENVYDKSVIWSSSNTSVAVITESGLVIAIGSGQVTITATAKDGSHVSDSFNLIVESTISGTDNGYQYVDLGLPSGTMWATCNVGEYYDSPDNSPLSTGGYYTWGDITPNNEGWGRYKWCNGTEYALTKYCTNSDYGKVDNITTLELEDDVAHVKWGGNWRIPTHEELIELRENCTWVSIEGVPQALAGILYKVVGPNGNSILIPGTGISTRGSISTIADYVFYSSSTLYNTDPRYAYGLHGGGFVYGMTRTEDGYITFDRSYGVPVRPVRSPSR